MAPVGFRDTGHHGLEIRRRQPFRRQSTEDAVASQPLPGDHKDRAQAIAPALQDKPFKSGAGGVLGEPVQVDVRAYGVALPGDAAPAQGIQGLGT